MPDTTLITVGELAGTLDADMGRRENGLFAISADIADTRIQPAIDAASDRLIDWVGEPVYDDALTAAASTDKKVLRRRKVLNSVEAHLSMHFLIINLGTQVTPRGLVVEAKEEGKTVMRYQTPAQMKETAEFYLAQAWEMCKPYLLVSYVPESEMSLGEI